MSLKFEGTITEVRTPRTGEGQKGEWASVEFEVTELNPQNAQYPQIALFDMFKNGDYVKYARDFEEYYPLNTPVSVEFNLKKNEYTNAKNEIVGFYKTSAWKIEKLQSQGTAPVPTAEAFVPVDNLNEEQPDDLPF